MIKVVYCFAKKSGLTDAEFDRYWRDVHGPIGARIPGLRRLVQSVAVRDPRDTREPGFDGMAELWFDDVAALRRARASAEWRAATDDEANFIDAARTAYFVTEERVVLSPDTIPPEVERNMPQTRGEMWTFTTPSDHLGFDTRQVSAATLDQVFILHLR